MLALRRVAIAGERVLRSRRVGRLRRRVTRLERQAMDARGCDGGTIATARAEIGVAEVAAACVREEMRRARDGYAYLHPVGRHAGVDVCQAAMDAAEDELLYLATLRRRVDLATWYAERRRPDLRALAG